MLGIYAEMKVITELNKFVTTVQKSSDTDKKYFVLWGGAFSIIAVLLIVFGIIFLGKNIVLDAELNMPLKKFKMYYRGDKNYPSDERSKYLAEQKEKLDGIYFMLADKGYAGNLLVFEDKIESGAALVFKERLYSVKSYFKNKERNGNFELPDDLGFAEWEEKLPPDYKVSELLWQLDTVKKVLDDIIAVKIKTVSCIRVSAVSVGLGGKFDIVCRYYDIFLSLHIPVENEYRIYDFLNLVINDDGILIPVQLNIVKEYAAVSENEKKEYLNCMITLRRLLFDYSEEKGGNDKSKR